MKEKSKGKSVPTVKTSWRYKTLFPITLRLTPIRCTTYTSVLHPTEPIKVVPLLPPGVLQYV
jgi:hypothetical protein